MPLSFLICSTPKCFLMELWTLRGELQPPAAGFSSLPSLQGPLRNAISKWVENCYVAVLEASAVQTASQSDSMVSWAVCNLEFYIASKLLGNLGRAEANYNVRISQEHLECFLGHCSMQRLAFALSLGTVVAALRREENSLWRRKWSYTQGLGNECS